MWVILWSIVHPNLIAWAWKQAELETIFERDEIIGKIMVLQITHLSYWDSPPCQNSSMKLGVHVNNIMIHWPSTFDSMSTKIGWVRNDFWKWWNNRQNHGTPDSSPVVLWFVPSWLFVYETWHACHQHYEPMSIQIWWYGHKNTPS